MRKLVYGLLILLAILHQDFWFWNDASTLVFGFLPAGLAYHVGISLAAGILWALAVRYCWPEDLDVPVGKPVDAHRAETFLRGGER